MSDRIDDMLLSLLDAQGMALRFGDNPDAYCAWMELLNERHQQIATEYRKLLAACEALVGAERYIVIHGLNHPDTVNELITALELSKTAIAMAKGEL